MSKRKGFIVPLKQSKLTKSSEENIESNSTREPIKSNANDNSNSNQIKEPKEEHNSNIKPNKEIKISVKSLKHTEGNTNISEIQINESKEPKKKYNANPKPKKEKKVIVKSQKNTGKRVRISTEPDNTGEEKISKIEFKKDDVSNIVGLNKDENTDLVRTSENFPPIFPENYSDYCYCDNNNNDNYGRNYGEYQATINIENQFDKLTKNNYTDSFSDINDEDPYDVMVNAFLGMNTASNEVNPNDTKKFDDENTPDILDISCCTGKRYCNFGPWDFEDSQESEKSNYIETDKDNCDLLRDTLRRGKSNSEWLGLPKHLPLEERFDQQKQSEESIITLAKARQTQLTGEQEIIDELDNENKENSPTESNLEYIELEKDRKCEEIAKNNNKIWRRPTKENPELLEGPVLNPPAPVKSSLVTFTPGGQKYVVNLMEGRPEKFKNVGDMLRWDLATKINAQRMIAQIEEGSFFPATLDYQIEKSYKNHIESQKNRLTKWLSQVSWHNLENDLYFLLAEKELIYADYLIKKWRADISFPEALEFVEYMESINVNKEILLKNPQILATLHKLTEVQWKRISQKASEILEKYKKILGIGTTSSLINDFQSKVKQYEKAKGHLRHLYQEILISDKFQHVANEDEV